MKPIDAAGLVLTITNYKNRSTLSSTSTVIVPDKPSPALLEEQRTIHLIPPFFID